MSEREALGSIKRNSRLRIGSAICGTILGVGIGFTAPQMNNEALSSAVGAASLILVPSMMIAGKNISESRNKDVVMQNMSDNFSEFNPFESIVLTVMKNKKDFEIERSFDPESVHYTEGILELIKYIFTGYSSILTGYFLSLNEANPGETLPEVYLLPAALGAYALFGLNDIIQEANKSSKAYQKQIINISGPSAVVNPNIPEINE